MEPYSRYSLVEGFSCSIKVFGIHLCGGMNQEFFFFFLAEKYSSYEPPNLFISLMGMKAVTTQGYSKDSSDEHFSPSLSMDVCFYITLKISKVKL